jgi:hypothetical protein
MYRSELSMLVAAVALSLGAPDLSRADDSPDLTSDLQLAEESTAQNQGGDKTAPVAGDKTGAGANVEASPSDDTPDDDTRRSEKQPGTMQQQQEN